MERHISAEARQMMMRRRAGEDQWDDALEARG